MAWNPTEVRLTPHMGYGVFATETIPAGTPLITVQGTIVHSEQELPADSRAVQIGPDSWIYSVTSELDDFVNHSCDPNLGFAQGDLVLYSLREIAAGEQLAWDYSTSISYPGWSLECACGSPKCRKVVHPWGELGADERERLRSIALSYLR